MVLWPRVLGHWLFFRSGFGVAVRDGALREGRSRFAVELTRCLVGYDLRHGWRNPDTSAAITK